MNFNVGDRCKLMFRGGNSKYYGKEVEIVEIAPGSEELYWIRLVKEGAFTYLTGTKRNDDKEIICADIFLVKKEAIKVYSIVKFCKEHYK
jgi:hypothetical protein